jgi:stalled ribosome rescue protein Dom34
MEEHRLRLFENRVLRRIFGTKREEVVEYWIRMHNEELHNLYTLTNIIREDEMGRACSINVRAENAYSILV